MTVPQSCPRDSPSAPTIPPGPFLLPGHTARRRAPLDGHGARVVGGSSFAAGSLSRC